MKSRSFLLPFASFILLTFSIISTCLATVVTFDDLSEIGTGSFIANSYQGLVWSNFVAKNAIIDAKFNGKSGYYYGMVSASNEALNAFGFPAEVDSATNFNFVSAYLTGAWRSNLNIQIQGFHGPTMLYNTTVVVSATSPTLFTLNYLNIDHLALNSFGGDYAGFGSTGSQFVMDNFTFEFVPEPSTLALVFVGLGGVIVFYKSRRVT